MSHPFPVLQPAFCPHTPQINRPPVKLNLLTCQVRPHTEEKKCFDLVTRECPQWDARAREGARPQGSRAADRSNLFGGAHPKPWHPGTLCPFDPALGSFTEEGPISSRRSSQLKTRRS